MGLRTLSLLLCLGATLVAGQLRPPGMQPYGERYGDGVIGGNRDIDDESFRFNLSAPMTIIGRRISTFYISSNGAVTLEPNSNTTAFSRGIPAYTTFVATYWDDSYLVARCDGKIFHRRLNGSDQAFRNLNQNLQQNGLNFNATNGVLITFQRLRSAPVGECGQRENTYQLAFMYNSTMTIAYAIWGNMTWVTPRGMAGFSAGDGYNYGELFWRPGMSGSAMQETNPQYAYDLNDFQYVTGVPFEISTISQPPNPTTMRPTSGTGTTWVTRTTTDSWWNPSTTSNWWNGTTPDWWNPSTRPPTFAPPHEGPFCDESAVLNITCRRGSVTINGQSVWDTNVVGNIYNLEVSTAVFTADNSFACRKKLYEVHNVVYQTMGRPRSKRNVAESIEVTCYEGRVSLSDQDPMNSESTSIRFRSGQSMQCRTYFTNFIVTSAFAPRSEVETEKQ